MAIQPKPDCGYPAKSLIDQEITAQVPSLITAQCEVKIAEGDVLANGDFYIFQYSSAAEALTVSKFPVAVYESSATPEITIRGGQQISCSTPVTALTISSNPLCPLPTYIKFTTHADWVQGTHLTMPPAYGTSGTFAIAASKTYLMTVILDVYSVEEVTTV